MVRTVEHVHSFAELDAKLKSAESTLVVVDFYATWCGPCKAIAPKVEQLAQATEDVIFLKIDVEECEDVVNHYDITSMPTFVFIKNGKVVDSFSGANYDWLVSLIQTHK